MLHTNPNAEVGAERVQQKELHPRRAGKIRCIATGQHPKEHGVGR